MDSALLQRRPHWTQINTGCSHSISSKPWFSTTMCSQSWLMGTSGCSLPWPTKVTISALVSLLVDSLGCFMATNTPYYYSSLRMSSFGHASRLLGWTSHSDMAPIYLLRVAPQCLHLDSIIPPPPIVAERGVGCRTLVLSVLFCFNLAVGNSRTSTFAL